MRIAVIGAGWAGLASAIKLHQHGHHVTVFESAKQLGGRARSVNSNKLSNSIDNGQHILIGAYQACFNLMDSLGINRDQVLYKQTLNLESLDKQIRFKFFNLPAPFNQLGVFFKSKGLSGLSGRLFMLRLVVELRRNQPIKEHDVISWFLRLKCPQVLIDNLWEPLCIATTNTKIQDTDANIFATILRKALLNQASDSDIYIPKVLLSELWPTKVSNILGDKIIYKPVNSISKNQKWLVDNQEFDNLIIATPFETAKKLIKQLTNSAEYLNNWPNLKYSAIGTLSLELAKPIIELPAMSLLKDEPRKNAWGQWLFNHYHIASQNTYKNLLQIVIGQAQEYLNIDQDLISNGIIKQIETLSGIKLPEIINQTLITEKRATFDAVPGLSRPGNLTPWQGLFLAGDWTDTNYPAVLEGAVISGIKAAEYCLKQISIK